ncbi:DNA/RNA polymerases superfamily protein [Gossypium australe]|uniref:DNA/RNA polymerases superfamily protein n=1 Tax=Gossypium australe TaxID=47621 RepID=A0A5B6WGM6_9ROSI|nr:DNA/RNA polymerases superfamily protein [Gossypium australe]
MSHSPLCWIELGKRKVLGPKLVVETEDKVQLIQDKLKAASNKQKSYAEFKRHEIEYEVGDHVFLKLELPSKLDHIRDVFHVSMLRCYRFDPSHVVPLEEIGLRLDLSFEEELIQILDHEVKVLRRKTIPLVKNHGSKSTTWEPEDLMHHQYPHFFESGDLAKEPEINFPQQSWSQLDTVFRVVLWVPIRVFNQLRNKVCENHPKTRRVTDHVPGRLHSCRPCGILVDHVVDHVVPFGQFLGMIFWSKHIVRAKNPQLDHKIICMAAQLQIYVSGTQPRIGVIRWMDSMVLYSVIGGMEMKSLDDTWPCRQAVCLTGLSHTPMSQAV